MSLSARQSNVLILVSIGIIVALMAWPEKRDSHPVTPSNSDAGECSNGADHCQLPESFTKTLMEHQ